MPTRKAANGPAKNNANATKAAKKAEKEALKLAKVAAKEAKALAKDDGEIFKKIYEIIQKEKSAGYDKLVDLIEKTPLRVLEGAKGGKSLLEKAIDIRSLKIVKLLVNKGVLLKAVEGKNSYLGIAVDSGDLDILKFLYETGRIDINTGYLPPLLKAIHRSDIKIMNYLLDNGANMNIDKQNGSWGAFLYAVRQGDEKIVKTLLERGIDTTVLDAQNRNAWFHLTWFKKNTVKIAKLLLDSGLDINKVDKNGYNPIAYYLIANYGEPIHPDLLKFLIASGANVNIKIGEGNSILHLFTDNYVKKDADTIKSNIKQLVDAGLNINIRNTAGRSPLLQIIINSHKPAPHRSFEPLLKVSILESLGADLNTKGPGLSAHRPISNALIETIKCGFYKTATFLIDKGVDMNWRPLTELPDLGRSALHSLAQNGGSPAVELLTYFLSRPGVDKDILANDGVTPLCIGIIVKNLANVKAFVEAGADVNKIFEGSNAGLNALYYAATIDLPIFEYLVELEQTDKEVRYGARGTLFNIAKNTNKYILPEVREFIIKRFEKKPIVKLWQGWSRANAAQFDGVFSVDAKEAADVTCCPICLKTVVRSDGCVYIQGHDCSQLEGFYHTELYEKYKNSEGRITWCTICGRIARGHRHYALGPAQAAEKPALLEAGDPFTTDCRDRSGGGGIEEKLARYRRMREYALELQGEVGKKSEKEALEEMVEEMWNAPMFRKAALRKIMEKREWNIPADLFPLPIADEPVQGEVDMTKLPNIEKPASDNDLLPVIVKGIDQIMQDEGDVIQFNHRQKDGRVFNHEGNCISAESLEMFITGQNGKFKTDESFGLCWAYPGNCNGRLYPSDVKPYVDPAVYNEYKDKFNWKFRAKARGGAWATRKLKRGQKSVFVPASNAQCYLPKRGLKK